MVLTDNNGINSSLMTVRKNRSVYSSSIVIVAAAQIVVVLIVLVMTVRNNISGVNNRVRTYIRIGVK